MAFAGKTIVFTGALSMTRKDAALLAEAAGFQVLPRLSGVPDYVVVGAKPGPTSEKAVDRGAELWHEDDFQAACAGCVPEPSPVVVVTSGPLYGKTVAFTGTLSLLRTEMTALAQAAGATVAGHVSNNTDILVAGKKCGSKLGNARDKGVTVWKEKRFLDEVGYNKEEGSAPEGSPEQPKAKRTKRGKRPRESDGSNDED
eukprot:TRINITY_DN51247_c0_g1_i1.p1 TRINITY_DN51247_c0_g1~~TRINITY_DN51247_c0_g1_i1.p1  ORF type:complete len:200 (+),score=48.99 TRINITY_DN51247_c0_g1_i1:137-736(+)